MTRRALIPNFTFEHEIAGRVAPRAAREQCQRWRYILRLAPGFEDALPIDECPEPTEVVAWGYSPEARRLAGAAAAAWPAADVVREANDKRTSHRIENALGVAMPRSAVVSSAEELRGAAELLGGRWVAKHPFGVSGRDQIRSDGADGAAVERAATLLADAGALVIEPLVSIEREWSVQFDVAGDGEVIYRGATELLTDAGGVFRGNVAPSTDLPADVLQAASQAIEHLAALGYRGPAGVDSHLGKLHGQRILRPIGEINARLTFGRLTLWLSDSFGGRRLAWHHPSMRRGLLEQSPHQLPLPDSIDPGQRSRTTMEVSRAGIGSGSSS